MIGLIVYLAVAGVLFFMCAISYVFVTEAEEETYSLIEKLMNFSTVAILWPALSLGALIFLVIEIRKNYAKSDGPTCGFCNAYYYRQLPGYVAPEVVYKEEQNAGEKTEYLPLPEWMLSSKNL